MMFDAFRVGLCYCVWHTQCPKESHHSLVAAPGFLRYPQAFIGQEYRAVRTGGNIPVALQPGNRADHCDMRDSKAAGKVNRSRFSVNGGKVSDGFGVILRAFHCMFLPRVSQRGSLYFGRPGRPLLPRGPRTLG